MSQEIVAPSSPGGKPPGPGEIVREYWAVLACWIAWAVMRFAYAGVSDDAFITFRYARNLFAGNGFVYNLGEQVYGTTSPLFALWCSLAFVVRVEPWTWALCWDVAWLLVILLTVKQFMRVEGMDGWFPAVGLMLVGASMDTLPVAGMETGVFIAATFTVLACACSGSFGRVFLVALTLATALRPEGFLVGVACLPAILRRRDDVVAQLRKQWLWAGLCLLALVAYFAFVLHAFGTLVPQSMLAKAAEGKARGFHAGFGYTHAASFLTWYGRANVVGLLAGAGIVALAWKQPWSPLTTYYLLYFGAFTLGGAPDFLWYHQPLYLLNYFFAAFAVYRAIPFFVSESTPPPKQAMIRTAMVAVLLGGFAVQGSIYYAIHGMAFRTYGVSTNAGAYRRTGEWLKAHVKAGQVVAANEIGIVGYFSEARIKDLEGLVSPEVSRAKREQPEVAPLEIFRPDFYVYPFGASRNRAEHPVFKQARECGYEPIEMIPWEQRFGLGGSTVIFARGEATAP